MPGKKARKRAPPSPARAPELEVECVTQLRKIENRLNSLGSVAEVTPVEMPGKKGWKNEQLPQVTPATPATPASALTEVELESGIQLRRFGDKVNFRQKLLNLISKLFSLVT
ncbi:phorbol-12-myristate-13-acetate-induced protein 1 [Ictidomys tridecemlineatus]